MKSKIHRCNCRKVWSIQNRKTTMTVSTMLLNGKWFVELKPERRCDPKGFVTTKKSEDIILNPSNEVMEQFERVAKLIYNKENVYFNVEYGQYLYFADDGTCYILKKRKQ